MLLVEVYSRDSCFAAVGPGAPPIQLYTAPSTLTRPSQPWIWALEWHVRIPLLGINSRASRHRVATYVQNLGQLPGRVQSESHCNHALRYGDLTASGTAGGLIGVYVTASTPRQLRADNAAAIMAVNRIVSRSLDRRAREHLLKKAQPGLPRRLVTMTRIMGKETI